MITPLISRFPLRTWIRQRKSKARQQKEEGYKLNRAKLVVSVISGSQISECKGSPERPELAQIQSHGERLNYILITVLNELFRDAPCRLPHSALMCRVKVINSYVKYNSRDHFQRYQKLKYPEFKDVTFHENSYMDSAVDGVFLMQILFFYKNNIPGYFYPNTA